MDHIVRNHAQPHLTQKSQFAEEEDVDELIRTVRNQPMIIHRHITKVHRFWFMRKFTRVVGYRGMDGTPCRWVAVLVDRQSLVTAYPVPHPKTMPFMRR